MPTDWESCYRTGETPWDKGAPAPPLLEWLESPGHRFAGAVLVPGCGLGYDVRTIAASVDATAVCGLDISPAALAQARRFPSAGNETYHEADLFDLPPGLRGGFDWVFEHTCFCAIDPARRPEYVRAVAGSLRPGGRLLAIFYLNPWKKRRTAAAGWRTAVRRHRGGARRPVRRTVRSGRRMGADARLQRARGPRADALDALDAPDALTSAWTAGRSHAAGTHGRYLPQNVCRQPLAAMVRSAP